MQMLFPIDTCTPEGIATLLLNMQLQFGSMEIVEVDGSVRLEIPKKRILGKTQQIRSIQLSNCWTKSLGMMVLI